MLCRFDSGFGHQLTIQYDAMKYITPLKKGVFYYLLSYVVHSGMAESKKYGST